MTFRFSSRPAPSLRGVSRAISRASVLLLTAGTLGACSTWSTYLPTIQQFGVYKLDINQGNYLSQDMVDKLKVGQTKQQVRTILGTPLLTNTFRPDRWDYVYEFRRQGRTTEQRKFTVYFADDKLARWEGDEMPQSVADLNRAADSKSLPAGPGAEDKGLWDRLLDLFKK